VIHLGISSWTLPWAVGFSNNPSSLKKMNSIDLVDYAIENQLDVVQLYNNIDLLSLTESDLNQVKQAAKRGKVAIEIGGVGIEPVYLKRMLKIAQVLEAKSLRTIIPCGNNSCDCYEFGDIIDVLSQSIGEFEDNEIQLLIENHDRYSSIEYRKIIESIGSKSLGICFDSANSLGNTEHFRESFGILKDYILCAHYKEYCIDRIDTKMGFIIQGCKPGEGENISEEFLSLLISLHRDISVILEQWIPYQGTIENTLVVEKVWADEGIRILKSLIK